MYLSSTAVKAFPLGKPRAQDSGDITSRIFYEQTVSNIIRQLIDTKGFLINCPSTIPTTGVLSSRLEFNLGGYWFEVDSGTNIFPFNANKELVHEEYTDEGTNETVLENKTCYIYACIELTSSEPYEISGQDTDTGNYEGLKFIASDISPDNFNEYDYFLPIFTGKTDSEGNPTGETTSTGGNTGVWNVYNDSFIKFDINSLNITGIDGKH